MFSRACFPILGRATWLPRVQGSRPLTINEQDTKGKYILKIKVEPFTEKEVKYVYDKEKITITARREKKTGKNNFIFSMQTSVDLPRTIKFHTIKAKFDSGFVVLEADSNKK